MNVHIYHKNKIKDIRPIVNLDTLSIEHSLCSTKWKSVTDAMSVDVVGIRDKSLYKEFIDILLSAMVEGEKVEIVLEDTKRLFTGYVDLSDLKIKSAKIPLSMTLSAKDYIVELDEKPKMNYTVENILVSDLIEKLLKDANPNRYTIGRNDLKDKRIQYFVLTEDNNKTYRAIIDTLLFECGGFVLYRNTAEGVYEIRSILSKETQTPRTINYLMRNGLESKYKGVDNDGVSINYPTVEMKDDALVYSENINLQENNNVWEGKVIAPGSFYPENGERVATFQSFKKTLLDKPYQEGTSSVQNSDLDLLYVKPENFKLEIVEEGLRPLTQPKVDAIGKPEGLQVYPKKAWCLLFNTGPSDVNLISLGMRGTAVYKTAKNTLVRPKDAKTTDEYNTTYIFSEDEAVVFSEFYYNYLHLANTISTWSEKDAISYIGEIVFIKHPETGIAQKHLVVSVERTGSDKVPTYNVTAVSISTYSLGDYKLSSEMYSPIEDTSKRVVSQTVYYAGTKDNIAPNYSDITLTIPPELSYSSVRYIWSYTRTLFADGTTSNSGIVCVGQYTQASNIKLELPTEITYYADNFIADEDSMTIKATADEGVTSVKIYINGQLVSSSTTNICTYTLQPSRYLDSSTSFNVFAMSGNISTGAVVKKVKMYGSLRLISSSSQIQFYADNVPYDNQNVLLSIESSGYKTKPTLTIDNKIVEYINGQYTLNASELSLKDKIEAKVEIAGFAKDIETISKLMDAGTLYLTASKTSFEYYADNVPHNAADTILITLTHSGFSTTPKVFKNGVETTYPHDGLVVKSIDLTDAASIVISTSIATFKDSIEILKSKDIATIALSLSDEAIEFYADNVPLKNNITAKITYDGLFNKPNLMVGSELMTLDEKNTAIIPSSVLNTVDSVMVKAFSGKLSYVSETKTIVKLKRNLVLSLGSDSSQFSVAEDGSIQPSFITLTNNTQGLSDNSKVSLMVAGKLETFATDETFKVTPEMIPNRYIVVTISYGGKSASMQILKTFDGKAEEVEYSKSKSFKIYPDESYEFTFSDENMTYNEAIYTWLIPWSKDIPNPLKDEYVWRRSRTDSTKPWKYARITGLQGTNGDVLDAYLGAYETAPTKKPDGTALEENCFYLNIATPGSPIPFKWDGSKWVPITATDPSWSYVASATAQDVNKYCMDTGNALLSTSAYYAYFQLLSAQKAFIENLGAQEITINKNGVIKSENWDKTDGAEGWKIEADGDASFNTGTWRGSFANGLSFIPPVKTSIDKNMTQQEAYRTLKKAGLSSGYYMTEPIKDFFMNQNQTKKYVLNPMGFRCFDYDSEKIAMNIPLNIRLTEEKISPNDVGSKDYVYNSIFGYIGYVIPLTLDSWLIAKLKKTQDGKNVEAAGLFILTLDNLQKAYNRKETSTQLPDYSDLLIPFEHIHYEKENLNRDLYIYIQQYVQVRNTNTIHLLAPFFHVIRDNGKTMLFCTSEGTYQSVLEYDEISHSFTVKASSMDMPNTPGISKIKIDGKIIASNYNFHFYLMPIYQFSKVDNEYQVLAYGPKGDNSCYNILKTTDFIDFKTIASIPVKGLETKLNMNGFPFYPIAVNNKVYFIYSHAFNPTETLSTNPYRFCCYDIATKAFEIIPGPQYYDGIKYSNADIYPNAAFSIGKLIYVKGIIYGMMYYPNSTNLFSYNISSMEYKDLTTKFTKAIKFVQGFQGEYHDIMLYEDILKKPIIDNFIGGATYSKYSINDICYDEFKNSLFIQALYGDDLSINIYWDITTNNMSIFSPCIISANTFSFNSNSGYLTDGTKINFVINQTMVIGGQQISFKPFNMLNATTNQVLKIMESLEFPFTMGFLDKELNPVQASIYSMHNAFIGIFAGDSAITDCSFDYDIRMFGFLNEERLPCSALYPIKGANTIIIEEDDNEYRICLASGFNGGTWTSFELIQDDFLNLVSRLAPDASIEPFIRIRKDSQEPVGATCYFDFPAQITTSAGIDVIYARNIFARITTNQVF